MSHQKRFLSFTHSIQTRHFNLVLLFDVVYKHEKMTIFTKISDHFSQGGETSIGKVATQKVWVPPPGRNARGRILNRPRRQMSFL
jgi:hypothetical protein